MKKRNLKSRKAPTIPPVTAAYTINKPTDPTFVIHKNLPGGGGEVMPILTQTPEVKLEYSTDGGKTWKVETTGTPIPLVKNGVAKFRWTPVACYAWKSGVTGDLSDQTIADPDKNDKIRILTRVFVPILIIAGSVLAIFGIRRRRKGKEGI